MVIRPLAARDKHMGALPLEELRERACRLRVVLSDCDGVLTDGGVFVSAEGEALKRFSLRDGMGVELLRRAGIESAILTRERSPIVARRAEKLGMPLFEGVLDKAAELPRLLATMGCERAELGYIGDDVNDLGVIEALAHVGLTAAPYDATPAVARAVHRLCRAVGGFGAFREFADWILALRADAAIERRAEELTR